MISTRTEQDERDRARGELGDERNGGACENDASEDQVVDLEWQADAVDAIDPIELEITDYLADEMTREEKKVIFASSLGTVFEWYDFYLYGSLAAFIGAAFFAEYPEATRNIFALLAFAAGFLVRPFGALVFGRIGDLVEVYPDLVDCFCDQDCDDCILNSIE